MDALTQHLTHLADGDREAFDPVYRLAWPQVRALCRRLLQDHPDAEDLAQQALLSVFERCGEYDVSVGPALPWILGIAGWSVRSHRRRQQRRRETAVPEDLRGVDLEERLIDADLERAVHAVIGTLSPLDRETLAAALSDRPSGATFRKRLQRALDRLMLQLGRTHGL